MEAPKASGQIQVNGITFKKVMPAKFLKIIITKKMSSKLWNKKWRINKEKRYLEDKWDLILPFILSAPCKLLKIQSISSYTGIIKNVSQINFINLIVLELGWNNIQSIQQLQFLEMPFLMDLSLCKTCDKQVRNCITSFNALNKCAWSSLGRMNLCSCLFMEEDNKVQHIDFARLKVRVKKFGSVCHLKRSLIYTDSTCGFSNLNVIAKTNFIERKFEEFLLNKSSQAIKCIQNRNDSWKSE